MSSNPPGASSDSGGVPQGDPWAAFGYLVAGVAFYGAIGFGLGVWLDASYLTAVGIMVGAGFGIYMVFAKYRYRGDDTVEVANTTSPHTPIDHDRPPPGRADRDDRGDMS